MNKRILLGLPLIFVLSACGVPSVEDFKSDQVLLKETIQECQTMTLSKSREDEACKNATEAYQQLFKEGINDAMNSMGEAFKGMFNQ